MPKVFRCDSRRTPFAPTWVLGGLEVGSRVGARDDKEGIGGTRFFDYAQNDKGIFGGWILCRGTG
jgi:hypothetical protein